MSPQQFQDEIRSSSFIMFFNILRCEGCRARFPGRKYKTWNFLQRRVRISNDIWKESYAVRHQKAARRQQLAVVTGFPYTDDAVIHELSTKRNVQVLRASVSASAYAWRDSTIKELVAFLICNCIVAVISVNGGCFP